MSCKQCDGLANWKDTYAWLHEFDYHRTQHEKLKKQVAALELENKKLKESVSAWKDAWFHLRDIIGNLWWHHPSHKILINQINEKQTTTVKDKFKTIAESSPAHTCVVLGPCKGCR